MARKGENIRKRKDGRWEARYLTAIDASGKKKYAYVYGHSYAEAKNKKYEKMAEAQTGISLSKMGKNPHQYTISELVDEWYIQIKCKVKISTMASYNNIVSQHILPELGELRVWELTNHDLSEFIQNKYKEGFSDGTVHLIAVVLKSILDFGDSINVAYQENLHINYSKKNNDQKKIMEMEHYEKLKNYLMHPSCDWEAGLLLCLCSGIRLGELSGLTWENIHTEEGYISINRTISRITNVNYKEDPNQTKKILYIRYPKTKSSIRDIPVSDTICKILEQWRKDKSCYLMTGCEHCMEPRTIQRKYKRLLEILNIPYVKIHSLRHQFSTLWIEKSFDSKNLAEILGHTSVKTTLDIYVHGNDKLKKEYMNQMTSGNTNFKES